MFVIRKLHDKGAWWATVHGAAKSIYIRVDLGCLDGKESTSKVGGLGLSLGLEDPLEKGMVNHSNLLAVRIPWTEEPGGLQSMES